MNKQELTIIEENEIKNRIHNIRGIQVIIDYDLAELYGVETKQLNRAVKRNIERFPKEFMFQLNDFEYKSLRFQFGTLKTGRGKHRKYLPYVFTEQGVAMLSAVLNSETAVKVSVQIMGAFVAMRRFLINNAQLFQRLDKTEQKLLEHDNKFEQVFNLIESKEIKPEKGIFFDGQIFDAHKLFSDIIRTANTSIILIDVLAVLIISENNLCASNICPSKNIPFSGLISLDSIKLKTCSNLLSCSKSFCSVLSNLWNS